MAIRFLFLVILIASCGRTSKEQNSDLKNDSTKVQLDAVKAAPIESNVVEMDLRADSLEKKAFWNAVVIPILGKDRETVLDNMDFPVLGDWTRMMEMKKSPTESTREDFAKVYNKFFNNEFINILSKQNANDIRTDLGGDPIRHGFEIQDSSGMSSVILIFHKHGDTYKLKAVQGAGGNFYYDYKKK